MTQLSLFVSLRSKLLESEAMNESLRRSLSRLSARSSYPASHPSTPAHALGSSPSVSMDAEMTDVIRQAKLDVERLKKKERNQRRKRWGLRSNRVSVHVCIYMIYLIIYNLFYLSFYFIF